MWNLLDRNTLALCIVWNCAGCADDRSAPSQAQAQAQVEDHNPERRSGDDSSLPAEPVRLGDGRVLTSWDQFSAVAEEADGETRLSPLRPMSGCSELESVIKGEALDHMNRHFDEAERELRRQSMSTPERCARIAFSPRQRIHIKRTPKTNARPTNMIAWSRPAAAVAATEVSSTNNQVAGVDEADFIKNDDRYVYAAMNGALRIIEAWPAQSAHEVANIPLEGEPKKLLVEGDRALVYVARPRTAAQTHGAVTTSPDECTYAYDCEFRGDGTDTTILLFDISVRAAPKQLRRIDVGASLIAARRIGDAAHTVLLTTEPFISDVMYAEVGNTFCEADTSPTTSFAAAQRMLAAQRAMNAKQIEATAVSLLQISEDGHDYRDAICQHAYVELHQTGSALTSLLSLSLSNDQRAAVSTIVSRAGAVYATGSALYLAVNQRESGMGLSTTMIHKFNVAQDVERSAYAASGQVDGKVLNQFSLDEHEAHLRVATSIGRVPSPEVRSRLSVLEQHGDRLELTGKVDDIAPGEDIRAVRFDRDRGFIVTFKKTDPLYALDLSDPHQPRISGELKIPGFSTYMHLLDDTHLLTIGYDAADREDFAYFTGILVQLFDVSDMSAPKLAHKVSIGTRGSSSQALNDHLAFTLFGDKLALPMTICEDGDRDGHAGTHASFDGLMLFDVSVERGISARGRVGHPNADGTYNDATCSTWWTTAKSTVKRSVFMEDFVYSISGELMRVQNLDTLGDDVASVALTD